MADGGGPEEKCEGDLEAVHSWQNRTTSSLRAIFQVVADKVISSAALPVDLRPLVGLASYSAPREGQFTRDQVLAQLADADALISLLNLRVDRELLAAGKQLKIVANFAVGYDNIDLEEASRRGIVVTNTPDALADALESGAITGAGLDVFEDEPQVPSRLLTIDRVVLTPRIASATVTARTRMAKICAEAVRLRLAGQCPPTALNPEAMSSRSTRV